MTHRHSSWKEGTISGLIGAVAVAAWFLVIDVIQGRPLFTPQFLGQALTGESDPTKAVIRYTAVHVLAFVLFGLVVINLVHAAVRSRIFRFALVMLFVAFEFFFVGVALLVLEGATTEFPIWSIIAANTIAATAMTSYLWWRHPSLRRSMQREALGS